MKLNRRRASAAGVFLNVAMLSGTLIFTCFNLSASTIVYGTGVNDAGAFLAAGAIDPHYSLIMGGTDAYVAYGATIMDSTQHPFPPGWPIIGRYVSSSTAQWIAPYPDIVDITGSGSYEYVTSFDLTGYDPTNFLVSGRFSVDNNSGGIFINGNLVPNTSTTDIYGYLGFVDFSITTGFRPGVNTLAFIVANSPMMVGPSDPNPTGLLVDISGAGPADPTDPPDPPIASPEPAVMWLSAGGLALLLLKRRFHCHCGTGFRL